MESSNHKKENDIIDYEKKYKKLLTVMAHMKSKLQQSKAERKNLLHANLVLKSDLSTLESEVNKYKEQLLKKSEENEPLSVLNRNLQEKAIEKLDVFLGKKFFNKIVNALSKFAHFSHL